jgi:peptidase E
MKLLLTSNGFIGNSLEKDIWDLAGNNEQLRVAIIPTAGDPIEWVPEKEGDPPQLYVARLTRPNDAEYGQGNSYQYFKNIGHDVQVVDLKEDPVQVKEKLSNVDVILVGGGDVNWLLDWTKKSKLDTYLKELLHKGIVYVGESAGSGILQPDIGLGWWEPGDKLDHVGLGIIDFVVSVHNKEVELPQNIEKAKERRVFMQSHMPWPWKVYFLQDGQAIKVDGEKIEHIGEGLRMSV